jgi:peptidoglycan/xylan/chitin deacetylase (PgdA/CDA1 family)
MIRVVGKFPEIICLSLLAIVVLASPSAANSTPFDELDYIGAFGTGPWLGVNTDDIKIISHGLRNSKKVALAFDDGPFVYTNGILDTLAAYNAKATFFLVGIQVEKFPKIAARIVAEGHQVGNHSYSHKLLTEIDRTALHLQIDKAMNVIYETVQVLPTVFRPPYRGYNDEILEYVNSAGMTLVLWDVDPKDWGTSSASLVKERIMSHIRAGSIITLHDLSKGTRGGLASLIESLQADGYQLVTVGELIEDLARENAENAILTEGEQ